ncbi:hypothetical protein [Candidatus Albibeggiatoa sp. nov. NOAA]|uniref:hypothetical protein n=1 Tax=Candidatus Albibeggiatoa sp. nov. NOAA TaxID=3162724 RepID=UPI0032FE268B|nr:hypothetical protein [Thiotrichaceae bacterium]
MMKKLLFILDCLLFFVMPISIIFISLLFFALPKTDMPKIVVAVPLICLFAIVGLVNSLNNSHDFYIKMKLILSLSFLMILLGFGAFFMGGSHGVVSHGISENSHLAILLSGGLLGYIARKIEDFKKKNDKRNRNQLIY